MPLEKDLETLRPYIAETLALREIKEKAAEADISIDELRSELEKRADEIWKYAGPAVSLYNDADEKYRATLLLAESNLHSAPLLVAAQKVVNLTSVIISLYILALVGYFSKPEIREAVGRVVGWPVLFALAAAPLVVLFAAAVYSARAKALRAARLDAELNALGTNKMREDAAGLHEGAKQGIARATLEECRELLDVRLKPSYSREMKVTKELGLSEVPSSTYVVSTEARDQLDAMLRGMPGGSIGIAGPRGAGKSTLLLAYCGGAVDKLNGRPVLGVLTSAPVEYDSRDFLLYLFQAVCNAVLKKYNQDVNSPPWKSEDVGGLTLSRRTLANVRLLGITLLFTGLSLVILAFLTIPVKPAAAAAVAEVGQAGEGSANDGGKARALPPGRQSDAPADSTPIPSPEPAASPAPAESGGFARYVRAFDLKPGTLLMWGVFLTLPGAALFYLTYFGGYEPERAKPLPPPPVEGSERGDAYVKLAWSRISEIKFQQSFTSGWSGALKLPVGLEGGLNRAVSMAEKQMSLPDIVEGLRSFINTLTDEFEVVIGIDELDKIESDEKAQQFVNQIKSIFGLRRCFYLVSVSESAMSNFERRGLPFRDAFDSSFDNILHVDYLTLDAAKRLIARRNAVEMPMPFRCLCYCASGGLARDLIRAARSLTDLARERPGDPAAARDMGSLCKALAGGDIRSKIRAVSNAAQKLDLEPETGKFLSELVRMEGYVVGGGWEELLPACESLRVSLGRELSADKEEAKLLAERRLKLAALGEELAIYVYYWDTMLRFFTARMSDEEFQRAEEYGVIHTFARARQSLSVKPAIARSIIDRHREGLNLPLLVFADPPPPQTPDNGHAPAESAPNALHLPGQEHPEV